MKRQNKEDGGQLFEDFYSQIYKERWPSLKKALMDDSDPQNWIPGLKQAYFLDKASIISVKQLDVQPGNKVLDLCAAPGGKSLHIAMTLKGSGELVSNDRSADRRMRLKKVLFEHLPDEYRTNIKVTGHDACKWGLYEKENYDRILLDAPCSSERHTLKSDKFLQQWSKNRTKILAQQSLAMLCSALMALKPQGLLLYSTCSISPWENEQLIERFEEKRKEQWNEIELHSMGEKKIKGRIILPDLENGCGPLYYCLIQKK